MSFLIRSFQLVLVITLMVASLFITSCKADSPPEISDRVFMEDMTSPEIAEALKAGKTTVIVPTGGTEQNGPHMITGKHHYVAGYTAGEVAKALGNALVAPTIDYVPEGQIDPPQGHMLFPGTISVPEDVFEAVLEYAARSFKAQGFKLICFLGDSGGNQDAQARVAKQLDDDWKKIGVRVLHMDEYYAQNGQVEYLEGLGNDLDEIGQHAGMSDTSELMAVYPEGIREQVLADNSNADFYTVGASGNAQKANAELGQKLLALKINAALEQIRDFQKE